MPIIIHSLNAEIADPLRQLGFPGGSVVKNLPVTKEMWVQSLGRKDLWTRKWQPAPVFLPGKSHGQRNLSGFSPWHQKETQLGNLAHGRQLVVPFIYLANIDRALTSCQILWFKLVHWQPAN